MNFQSFSSFQREWHAKKPFKPFKKKYTQNTKPAIATENENENPTTKESPESKEEPVVEEPKDKSIKTDGDMPASAKSDAKETPNGGTSTDASTTTETTTTNDATTDSMEKAGYNLRKKSALQPTMCPIVEDKEKESVENEVKEDGKDRLETEKTLQGTREATTRPDDDNFKVLLL